MEGSVLRGERKNKMSEVLIHYQKMTQGIPDSWEAQKYSAVWFLWDSVSF